LQICLILCLAPPLPDLPVSMPCPGFFYPVPPSIQSIIVDLLL
jgi:hypothetical protein